MSNEQTEALPEICRNIGKPVSQCTEHNLHCGYPQCVVPRATPSPAPSDTLEALDRIEATLDVAERIMGASPFWDDNSRHAGRALLDYLRSQIAAERAILKALGGSHD